MSGGRPNKSSSETTTFGEKKMWEKWKQMKMEMKKIFTRLPVTYHKMKSGTQLYEVYDNIIRDHWKEQFPNEAKDRTDAEIDENIDPMFWLEECQYILSVKVHRANGEWTTDCADKLPGPTRDAIRQNVTSRKCDSKAKFVASRLDSTVKEAIARENVLRSRVKRETQAMKNVESKMKIAKTKLKLLEEMKEEYVKHNGEEKYAKKRATLMNALIDAGDEDDVSTGVSTKMSTGVLTKSMSELDNSV
eukprot:scaffold124_cov120-Alexandrium_tamarense.AAC.2